MDKRRVGGVAGTVAILLFEGALQISGVESPALAIFILVLAVVPLTIAFKPGLWTDQVARWQKRKLFSKPPPRQPRIVPPTAVTVSLPMLQPRRYNEGPDIVDAIDVVNSTDRRQFRAEVLFLYGSEQEFENKIREDHSLLWEKL